MAREFIFGEPKEKDLQKWWIWKQPVPEATMPGPGVRWGVQAVAISGNNKSVVVAYRNGTLGWHRLEDGERYLTAFIHAEDRRWVAWTPSGYYWASPGAEEFLGWHINHGMDQTPDFIPIAQQRDRYARPEVVQAILKTRDEEKALARVQAH